MLMLLFTSTIFTAIFMNEYLNINVNIAFIFMIYFFKFIGHRTININYDTYLPK